MDDSELMEDAALLSDFSDLELKDYSESKNIEKDIPTPFTLVHTNTGQEIVVRKSSICWLLNKSVGKLSSDRMQRVQENELNKKNVSYKPLQPLREPQAYGKIVLRDWCLFQIPDHDKCLIGVVLSFAYMEE